VPGGTIISNAITANAEGGADIDNTARQVSITATEDNNANYTVQIGNVDITITSDGDATADEVSAALAAAINNANIDGVTANETTNDSGVVTIDNASPFVEYDVTLTATGGSSALVVTGGTDTTATLEERADTVNINARQVAAGEGYRLTIGGQTFDYVAKTGDDINDVAEGLKAAVDKKAPTIADTQNVTVNVLRSIDPNGTDAVLQIDNNSSTGLTVAVEARDNGTATGGLRALDSIDVSTADGAIRALDNIESLIQTSIDAAASFGSAQRRIDIQSEFITSLTDSLKSGIGALVDADLEAASARLQSLQVQQQLGIQALSIANQNPQTLLALFR